jgi:hypothetical protein
VSSSLGDKLESESRTNQKNQYKMTMENIQAAGVREKGG